jgi:hypothetical protein
MGEASHLARLERAGNIGVALGKASEGLVTIDLDQDSYVDAFVKANPLLWKTLRTRAARGCNVWLRCPGDYPQSCNLTDVAGHNIGEWRADGCQTIIAGIHPSGVPYQFVVEHPVITLSYDAVIWPNSTVAPRATESQRVRRVRENEVVVGCVAVASPGLLECFFNEDTVSQVAPTDYRQNNASLFKLARLVISYEHSTGGLATTQELELVFDQWAQLSQSFWRHTRDHYWAEFLEAYSYARIGLGEDPIKLAITCAKAGPLPQVQGFTEEPSRLLAAVCREMQQITGSYPFFLPTRKLGELFGTHWTCVARWLRAFEVLEIIHLAPGEVRKAGGNRSPRYYYGTHPMADDAITRARARNCAQ